MSDIFDVLVVGGGPVGACAAALLARGSTGSRPLRVGVIEPKRPEPIQDAAPIDARVVAISRASERILSTAGAGVLIHQPRTCPYERMRIWHESVTLDSGNVLEFDAAEVGEPDLGRIVESRLLQAALLDAFTELDGGDALIGAEFAGLHVESDRVVVHTSEGDRFARLVVGADGAQSAVRCAVGLTAETSNYEQTAIVATVATERPHARTAWQRFMRDGTLAFLPLADGNSSIVWSADDAVATRLLNASKEEFAADLTVASAGALGATKLVSERSSFPLRRLAAHHYVAQRVALVGDAAHVVHPLAGQGVNLGLLDAAALAQVVLEAGREREDPGALRALRAYERWRKSEVAFMSTAIDCFDRFLAHGRGPVSRLAQHGLGWVNRSQEAKRFFIRRALGLVGELPAAARLGAA